MLSLNKERISDKMQNRKTRPAPQAASNRKITSTASPKPNKETEVKLRVTDRQALLRQLKRLRAIYQGRVHEMNTLYDTPSSTLRRKGQLLRIRVERPAKRPQHRPAISAEIAPARTTTATQHCSPTRGRLCASHRASPAATDGTRFARSASSMSQTAQRWSASSKQWVCGTSFRYEKYRSTYRLPVSPAL